MRKNVVLLAVIASLGIAVVAMSAGPKPLAAEPRCPSV